MSFCSLSTNVDFLRVDFLGSEEWEVLPFAPTDWRGNRHRLPRLAQGIEPGINQSLKYYQSMRRRTLTCHDRTRHLN